MTQILYLSVYNKFSRMILKNKIKKKLLVNDLYSKKLTLFLVITFGYPFEFVHFS
jgi:hypothetical protein